MSDIERQRAAVTAQRTATDYTQQQRYPAAEPLFITCMCGSFASILSAAVAAESLVADVNNYAARDGEEPIGGMRQKIDIADALAGLPEELDATAPLPVPQTSPVTLDELPAPPPEAA